jgi:cation:H+ antiporter
MTTLDQDLHDVHPRRQQVGLLAAVAVTLPGSMLGIAEFGRPEDAPALLTYPIEALLFGLAIVGAAFLLSWAAETAQLDISAGLAIAILALIAVLPEYAVDFVFAFEGGRSFAETGPACLPLRGGLESPCSLALANMTGANRLLIGVGWPLVVFIAWYRLRRGGRLPRKTRWEGIRLDRDHAVEVSYLAVATAYSLTLPLKGSITLVDAAVLVTIFALYTLRIAKAPAGEPHLVGPARYLGTLATRRRRIGVVGMMLFAAIVILLVAEPFAHSLVLTGKQLGIGEFYLVQWVAPLASEAPELLVAGLYAWRLNTNAALGTLVSSKVNQWTLLVGTLPIVFAIASQSIHGLPIDDVQREELFLTAAQSFFAVGVMASLSLNLREAWFLFGLFWAQFIIGGVVPDSLHGTERLIVGIIYIALGLFVFLGDRRRLPRLFRDGFRTSYAELSSTGAPGGTGEEGE